MPFMTLRKGFANEAIMVSDFVDAMCSPGEGRMPGVTESAKFKLRTYQRRRTSDTGRRNNPPGESGGVEYYL